MFEPPSLWSFVSSANQYTRESFPKPRDSKTLCAHSPELSGWEGLKFRRTGIRGAGSQKGGVCPMTVLKWQVVRTLRDLLETPSQLHSELQSFPKATSCQGQLCRLRWVCR